MRTVILALAASLFFLSLVPNAAKADATLDAVLASTDWLNSAPSHASLRGKVVLVDFYTFDCINCKNVEPNLRALNRTLPRSQFAIIGVHSPETPFEHVRSLVIASTKVQGVVWPVAIDNDFKVWSACGISAWPTQLIFDRRGRLRATIVGDSQDALVNDWVTRLVREGR